MQRLAFMIDNSDIFLLVSHESLSDSLPSNSAQLVCLDADWDAIAVHSRRAPGIRGEADNLAYVIYTSGSTGKPKGVCVTQRAIVRLVKQTDYAQLRQEDKVGQVSNVSFDAATFEIWGALLNGAELEVVSREVMLSAKDFAEQIQETGIRAMFMTTALFNEMAREQPGAFKGMKHLLAGGEAVDARRMREVLKAGGPERLGQVDGPTESTTFGAGGVVEEGEE